jgi:hypothetical protein
MELKQRHGILTAYIVLGLIVNALNLIFIIIKVISNGIENSIPIFQLILMVMQIVFFIALYKWAKWGLYGLFFTSLGYSVLSLYLSGVLFTSILWFLIFNAILGGVLALKKGQNSGWANLE